ncbi:response regulator transcription factor [Actinomycetospora flava]|uniref:Response regulator transcription factor n=1 Tax=Actinomycetospora flava TaxID=3129232 RepID=A0ABU8M5F8_9PSEU
MPIRIVLADDDRLVRAGLLMILNAQHDIEVVAEAGDGEAALAAIRRHHPDVAVVDVRMPVLDGVEVARALAALDSVTDADRPVGVVMITNFHVSEAVYEAMRAGATGFVLKDAAPSELVSAIRSVADGEAWLDPAVTRDLIEEFARRPMSVLPPVAEVAELTKRERDVLALMAHGLSNDEIGEHFTIVTATVKTHVNRIFMKLGIRDRAQAVALAYRSRLVALDEPLPRSPRSGA